MNKRKVIIPPKEQTFYGTFQFGMKIELEGKTFNAWNYWIEITAKTKEEAEKVMSSNFKGKRAGVYFGNQFTEKDKRDFYPKGCLMKFETKQSEA